MAAVDLKKEDLRFDGISLDLIEVGPDTGEHRIRVGGPEPAVDMLLGRAGLVACFRSALRVVVRAAAERSGDWKPELEVGTWPAFSLEPADPVEEDGAEDPVERMEPPLRPPSVPPRLRLSEAPTDDASRMDDAFKRIGLEIGELVAEKNRAYGNSFNVAGSILRHLYPVGIDPDQYDDALAIIRILDKLKRIATDRDALGETPFRDIAGYGILGAERVERIRAAAKKSRG